MDQQTELATEVYARKCEHTWNFMGYNSFSGGVVWRCPRCGALLEQEERQVQ